MGLSQVSGPLYGAKSLLFADRIKDAAASTGTTVIGSINVPTGQDWYVTDVHAWRGSTASTGFQLVLSANSTTVATVSITSSLAGAAGQSVVTPTAGEFEGARITAGSSVTLSFNQGGSSVAASTAVAGWVYGYIRYVDSSRTLNS